MDQREGLQELADIAADLEAWALWEGLRGAVVLPRSPPGAAEATFGPPVELARAEPARAEPARPGERRPPAPAPRARPAPEPARPAAPSAMTEARPPAASRPDPQVGLPTRWAALAKARDPAAELAQVRADLGDCQRCGLCKGRKNIVFGVGNPEARLLVVGEAPGAREDELGEPFVGAAGEMLDRMLAGVLGLTRADVYILNVVKCRPPDNRDPQPPEVAACRPFLEAQIAAIQPRLILAVGRVAAQALLETSQGINALRGRWHLYNGRTPVMPTYHPAYLLRQPDDKRKTWDDLLQIKQRLQEP